MGIPHLTQFASYCVNYILLGSILFGLGPMIPYYAVKQGRKQTDYTSVLLARMIGYIIGSFSAKITQQKLTIHQNLSMSFYIGGLFIIIFNYVQTMLFKMIFILLAACGLSLNDIFCNIGTITCFKTTNQERYLQILHGCMGIGGLVTPFIVYAINYQTYLVLGIIVLILATVMCFIPSPQTTLQLKPDNSTEQKEQQHQVQSVQSDQNEESNIPMSAFVLLCASCLIVIGVQATFGTWISTFCVSRNLKTKQSATLYNTIFYCSITFFRFFFVFCRGGKAGLKLGLLSLMGSIVAFSAPFLIFHFNSNFGLIFTALFLGFCIGPSFAFLLTLVHQYGYQLTSKQVSTLMVFAIIGEGVLPVIVGKLIEIIFEEIFYYAIGFLLLTVFLCNITIKLIFLNRDKQLLALKVEIKQQSEV